MQPEMLFFENVHGFTIGFTQENNPKYPYSEKLIKALENEGYNIDHKMITMSDYGVPQKRIRFILFGIKNGNPKKFFERLEKGRTQFLSRKGYSMPVTIKEAIGDLKKDMVKQSQKTPKVILMEYMEK